MKKAQWIVVITEGNGGVMNANPKNGQFHQYNEQSVTLNTRVAYEPPVVTVMGKVEHLTALIFRGVPDLESHGNIL